jgi:hypothetical protein
MANRVKNVSNGKMQTPNFAGLDFRLSGLKSEIQV